jgi:hypothetical protein
MVHDDHPLVTGDRLAGVAGNPYLLGPDRGHDSMIALEPYGSERFRTAIGMVHDGLGEFPGLLVVEAHQVLVRRGPVDGAVRSGDVTVQ